MQRNRLFTKHAPWALIAVMLCLLPRLVSAALAQELNDVKGGETIAIAGVENILIRGERPKGSLILMTGGDGKLDVHANGRFTGNANNVLIRNRDAFAAKGYAVLLFEKGTDLAQAVETMARIARPVVVVATSAGTPRAAKGLVQGAQPDKLVLTSGILSAKSGPLQSVAAILGDPRRLPQTLVVHHRQDGCRLTRPAGVAPFKAWAGPKVKVAWLSGGTETGNPCRFAAHHGFAGQDGELVALIAGFVGRNAE